MAFGCFLWLYYPSFGESYVREINARFYGVPIFANQIAQNIGFILLLFGLILLFLKSWLYGIIGLGVIFLVIQLLKWLEHIDAKRIEKEVSDDPDCQIFLDKKG